MQSKLTLALVCACALVVALMAAAGLHAEDTPVPPADTQTDTTPLQLQQRVIQRLIDRYRHETWRWQRTMGRPLTRRLANPPLDVLAKIAVWKRVAVKMRQRAEHPPHKRQWLCIHRFEGAWTDPSPTYYGGLQMDLDFQRTYGQRLLVRKGTANHWTPLEQMWVAETALKKGKTFEAWPTSARLCGLI